MVTELRKAEIAVKLDTSEAEHTFTGSFLNRLPELQEALKRIKTAETLTALRETRRLKFPTAKPVGVSKSFGDVGFSDVSSDYERVRSAANDPIKGTTDLLTMLAAREPKIGGVGPAAAAGTALMAAGFGAEALQKGPEFAAFVEGLLGSNNPVVAQMIETLAAKVTAATAMQKAVGTSASKIYELDRAALQLGMSPSVPALGRAATAIYELERSKGEFDARFKQKIAIDTMRLMGRQLRAVFPGGGGAP